MFERFLHFFWIEIVKRCNHKRKVEIFKHVKFHDSLLIISAHDLKLQIKWKIAIETRVNFLQHLQLCFHWRINYFSRQNYWLDFDMKDISMTSSHDFAVILLRKINYLRAWVNQFRYLNHVRVLIRAKTFSWVMTWNVNNVSMKLKDDNVLRHLKQMTYHKTYNLHKNI